MNLWLIGMGASEELATSMGPGLILLLLLGGIGIFLEAKGLLPGRGPARDWRSFLRIAFSYVWRLSVFPVIFIGAVNVVPHLLGKTTLTPMIRHAFHQTFLENPNTWQGTAGTILYALANLWVFGLLHLAVQVFSSLLKEGPRQLLALLGITALGAWLRIVFSTHTLMGMSNYIREPNIIWKLQSHSLNFHSFMPEGTDRFETIMTLNLAVSILLPVVFYSHAVQALRERRHALVATLFFAIAPIPIFFGASDAQFVTSMLYTCGTLALIHAALSARRWYAELFYGTGALNLFALSLGARQINMVFFGVAILAGISLLYKQRHLAAARGLWAISLFFAGITTLKQMFTGAVGHDAPLGVRVTNLLEQLGNPQNHILEIAWDNFYLGAFYFPLPITLLACLGLVHLWRQDRTLFLYLTGWFVAFYTVHCLAWASNIIAAARYGFHTITPVFFAAGVGFFEAGKYVRGANARWPEKKKQIAALIAGVTLLTSYMGYGLFRLPPTDLQEEYSLLRSLAQKGIPPEGATVVELDIDETNATPLDHASKLAEMRQAKRFDYFGHVVKDDALVNQLKTVNSVQKGISKQYLFIGLPCFWLRKKESNMVDVCEQALKSHAWIPVETHTVQGISHDVTNGHPALGKTIGLYRLDNAPQNK